MTGRWLVQNMIFSHLCNTAFPQENIFRLRYEQLAGETDHMLSRLGLWLGLDFPKNLSENFRESKMHAIAGNKMRWEDSKIKLDEAWRSELPKSYAQLTFLLTLPLARVYGYR